MPEQVFAGRYRLVTRIGSGAMGQVWHARDERLVRDVAIKLVDLSATTDAATADRFHREAVATANLNHRNIVTIFDAGTQGATAFLVMELLPGRSLAEVLRADGPLSIGEAARIGAEVAAALEATHAIGVVHRDIKPANIMVNDGSVKLLDFGIAQFAEDSAHLTATHTTIGTAAYMSPEQAMGRRAGPASDVYSLGCVLVSALTGRPPFPGDNAIQVASRQISDPAPSVRGRRPDVPLSVDALVAGMMAKEPAARPSAATVRQALSSPLGPAASSMPSFEDSAATTVLRSPGATVPMGAAGAGAAASATVPQGSASGGAPQAAAGAAATARQGSASGGAPQGYFPDDRRFKRAAGWIALAIAALLAIGIVWALGTQLVNQIFVPSAAPTQTATPKPAATPKPTATRKTPTPAPPVLPSLPSLPALPSMPALPTIPNQLEVSVAALDAAIDRIDGEASAEAAKAKSQLQSTWKTSRKQIVENKNARQALTTFEKKFDDVRDDLKPVEYVAIMAAVKAVDSSI